MNTEQISAGRVRLDERVQRSPLARANTTSAAGGPRSYARMTWLTTSHGRPVAARIDEPADGNAVGALVIVPSFGRESIVMFRRLRTLAVRAADAGYLTISINLTGDGESPDPDPADDLVQRWRQDVQAAVDAASAAVGSAPVNLIGWRLGASVAHAVAHEPHNTAGPAAIAGAVVAWEPVSGSSYVRQHQNLRKFASSVAIAPGGVELCGAFFTDAHVKSLSKLVAPRASVDERDLIHTETDRGQLRQLTLGSPHFVRAELRDADGLIAGLWRRAPMAYTPVSDVPTADWVSPQGRSVSETFIVVGPDRLPGVLTLAPQVPARTGALFTAIGSELRAGPGNSWSMIARRLATEGVVSLRMDRRYLGEDTDVTDPAEPYPYTDQSVADLCAAADDLRARTGAPIVGVGACSGAWSVLRASAAGGLAGLLAVNPIHWDPDPANYDEAFYRRTYQAEGAFAHTLDAAAQEGDDAGSHSTWRLRIDPLLHKLAIRFPRLRSRLRGDRRTDKVHALLLGIPSGTRALLAMGLGEAAVFRAKGGAAYLSDRRRAHGLRVQVDPLIDHSLFALASREQVYGLVRELAVDEHPTS